MNDEKYVVFGYDQYYPTGGMNDFKKSFVKREDAIAWLVDSDYDYGEVVEKSSWDIVFTK